MSKLKTKVEKIDLILLIIVILLLIINITLYLKNILLPQQEQQQTYQLTTANEEEQQSTQTITIPKNEEELIQNLSTLGERERMEYYCGIYFDYLEKGKYELAYNLLYPEFKQTYFPTLEEYKQYIQKTYPSIWALEYNDITRQGSIYVLKLDILDIIGGSKDNEISQRIVVKENNYNDFVISFQVI